MLVTSKTGVKVGSEEIKTSLQKILIIAKKNGENTLNPSISIELQRETGGKDTILYQLPLKQVVEMCAFNEGQCIVDETEISGMIELTNEGNFTLGSKDFLIVNLSNAADFDYSIYAVQGIGRTTEYIRYEFRNCENVSTEIDLNDAVSIHADPAKVKTIHLYMGNEKVSIDSLEALYMQNEIEDIIVRQKDFLNKTPNYINLGVAGFDRCEIDNADRDSQYSVVVVKVHNYDRNEVAKDFAETAGEAMGAKKVSFKLSPLSLRK